METTSGVKSTLLKKYSFQDGALKRLRANLSAVSQLQERYRRSNYEPKHIIEMMNAARKAVADQYTVDVKREIQLISEKKEALQRAYVTQDSVNPSLSLLHQERTRAAYEGMSEDELVKQSSDWINGFIQLSPYEIDLLSKGLKSNGQDIQAQSLRQLAEERHAREPWLQNETGNELLRLEAAYQGRRHDEFIIPNMKTQDGEISHGTMDLHDLIEEALTSEGGEDESEQLTL